MAAIVVGLEKHHAIAEQLGMAFVTGRPAVGQFSKLISIAVEGRRRWISGRIGRLSLPVPNKPLYSGIWPAVSLSPNGYCRWTDLTVHRLSNNVTRLGSFPFNCSICS
ncbi:Thiazole synthase [Trichinella spiralis]|uniref:Thiazole synthase n=1 Tax=Trichinella spiralis TaxID=6334 RepID=A0ABR3L2T9_TRISP